MQYVNSFRKLVAWKEAKKIAVVIYKITDKFPKEEKFGLISQMRRCSYSVPANIAEGNAREKTNDRLRFFTIAKSSLVELDNFLDLSKDLQFINEENYKVPIEQLNKTAFLLTQLKGSLINKDS